MIWNRRSRKKHGHLSTAAHATQPTRKLRAPAAAVVEMLEQRTMLAGEPLITEFLASNVDGIRDQFNRSSDWIEIRNPLSSNLNIGGYHLTDNSNDLTKWTFPAGTILGGGGYMVVFASGDDVTLPNQPLHTNFEIDAAGGFLALVAPNGTTILSSYDYPEQISDTSYGIAVASSSTPLLNPGALVKTHFPTSDVLGTSWTSNGFNDGNASWRQGTTGVGYEADPPLPPYSGFAIRMVDTATGFIGSIAQATSVINGTYTPGSYTIASDTSNNYPTVNMAGGGNFSFDHILPNGETNADAPGRTNFALRVTANVTIPVGTWTLDIGSDDGFRLRIPGARFIATSKYGQEFTSVTLPQSQLDINETLVHGAGRGHAHTGGALTVTGSPLTTTMTLDYFEGGSADDLELSAAVGQQASFNTAAFSLLANGWNGWTISSPNVTPQVNYNGLIGQNVQADMLNVRTTAYMRMPFAVSGAAGFDTLRLRMKYDDGFVAYVNGVKIAERNAPLTPVWNSAATGEHPDAQALVFEDIDITLPPGLLINGTNTLAIHGLNDLANSPDFLIVPSLAVLSTTVLSGQRYMTTPTPGTLNNTSNINGVVADTEFNVDRGFYEDPFQLVIATQTPGAQIRYTLNGSAPTEASGILYSGPITIDKTTTLRAAAFRTGWISSGVDTQTYIFLDDVLTQSPTGAAPNVGGTQWPGGTVNGQILNYGMDPDIVNNPTWSANIKNDLKAIPSINIAMDPNDLFNITSGIYVNAGGDGRAWERRASIELIDPLGLEEGFQVNAGIRIRGGFSVQGSNPKHSFRLFFREEYGDSKLKYPLFADDPTATDEFDGIDLRTFQNYSWSFGGDANGIFTRDQLSRDMQLAQGHQGERGKFYHLYIDGQYWGIFNTAERPEASFAESYYGGDKEDYDVIKPNCGGCPIFATDGNLIAWQNLWTQAKAGLTTVAAYQKILGNNPDGTRNPDYPVLLDADNLIDYMFVILHGGNLDAPITNFGGNSVINNWFGSRPRNGASGFRFFAHDSEHTILPFNSASFDRTGPYIAGNTFEQSNPQWLWQQLGGSGPTVPNWDMPGQPPVPVGNLEFRLRVADHIQDQFIAPGGVMTRDQVLARFDKRTAELTRAVVGESARWGDSKVGVPYTRNTWLNAVATARNFLLSRSTTVQNQLIADGNWPKLSTGVNFNAPVFNQHGGNIGTNFNLIISNPNTAGGTIYYTLDGSDPRLIGGAISPTAIAYSGAIPLNTSVQPKARVRYMDGGNVVWSALTTARFRYNLGALHVTEVMYNPAPPPVGSPYTADDFEYIELQNTGTFALQIGGVTFDEGITFTLPATTLTPGARTLVVKNRAAFESRYGTGLPIAGEYIGLAGGALSNSGEDVNIRGPVNEQLIHFNYHEDWYPITNGGGYSLVVRDPSAAQVIVPPETENPLSKGSRWRPSNLSGGGPGGADAGINPEAIVINEAVSHSTNANGDWIELRSLTNSSMNIGGWFLSDDALNLRKYQIQPDTIIPAGEYLVFYSQLTFGVAGNPGVSIPFTLDEVNGAAIHLTNNNGPDVAGYREFADFGASPQNVAFGRYVKSTGATDFTQLVSPTPNAANSAAEVGPLIISEVNYNPNAGGSEFIEIENITDFPVQLWDPAHPNNTWKMVTGIDFTFPTNTTIPGFGSMILIPGTISIAAFRSAYGVPAGVQVFQYAGALDNGGEDLKLGRPLAPVGLTVPYQLVDKVKYGDTTPWPILPDGDGPSLERVQPITYGNDPSNWKSGPINGNPGIVIAPPRPPVVEIGANATIISGVTFSRSGAFSDVNQEQTYSGTVNWGDGTPTQAVTLNADKSFALNHRYTQVGTFTVTVTITDSYPEVGTDTLLVNVTPSTPPDVNAGPDASAVEGDAFTQGGSFSDPDVGQFWSATVNWGDGGPTVALPVNADKTFNLNHVYATSGNFTVTVTVTDSGNVSDSDTILVSAAANTLPAVSNVPNTTIAEDGTFSGGGSFADPNVNQSWSATINWGEGGSAEPLSLNPDKSFNLSHLYANPGTYTATVTVSDNLGSGVETFVISVLPSPRLGSAGPDTFTIRRDPTGAYIEFYENRTIAQGPSYFLAHNVMQNYTFNAVQDNDTLVVDLSNGNPVPAGGMSFNGGGHVAPGDLLLITGSSGNDEVRVTASQVMVGGMLIDYPSTERIQFDGGAGNDTLAIDEGISFSPLFSGGTGSDSIIVNQGTYRLTADASLTTANLNLVATAEGVIVAAASQHVSSITLSDTARLTMTANGTRVLRTAALTVAPTAVMDLNDNNLILQATAANKQQMYAMVRDLLFNGRSGGAWNGATGIRSTTAANNPLRSTGLGAIVNDRGDGTVVRGQFEGETVTPESILIKYTYNGDANLDGTINADDYALIDAGYAAGLTGYYHGDFDYSGGKPDADDYFRIDKAFSDQGAVLASPAAPAAAPAAAAAEPAAAEPVAAPAEATAAKVPDSASKTRPMAAVKTVSSEKKTKKKTRHHRHEVRVWEKMQSWSRNW